MSKVLTPQEKLKRQYIIVVNLIIFFILISLTIIFRYVYITYIAPDKGMDINSISSIEYDPNVDMVETILNVKNAINNYYNVDIFYDSTISGMASSVNATVISENRIVLDMLQSINSTLSKYPKDVFLEIQNKGYKIIIYLVDHFNNGNIALANRTSTGRFNVYISNDMEIEKAFHHEMYHIFEYYIKLEYDLYQAFGEWNLNNPEGFEYTNDISNLTSDYVFGKDFSGNPLCFVTVYSKFSEPEDRAEIFSEMMINNTDFKAVSNCQGIVNKMTILSNSLNEVFSSVRNAKHLYWERNIN